MSGRVNPFADLSEMPVFAPKSRPEKLIASETIERIAEQNNFPSRQAQKQAREKPKKRRVYTTGRNRQFNIKATTETVERFCRMADERKIPLCELLELALDALEKTGYGMSTPSQ